MSLLPPSVVLPFHARYLEQQLSFGIRNANEEKQGAEASDNVRLGNDGHLLKQLSGTVGGTTRGISSAIEKTLSATKTTYRGVRAALASKLRSTPYKLVSGKQQKGWVDTQSGPHSPHERIQKRAGEKVTLERGSVVGVVKNGSVYQAVGQWFSHDFGLVGY